MGHTIHLRGWKRSKPHPEDLRHPKGIFDFLKPLPSVIDLAPFCSPVEDQGNIGSCVGNATVGQLELLMRRVYNVSLDLSRLMVYYGARQLEGTQPEEDSGCEVRDAYKFMAKTGTCLESLWPYVEDKFSEAPSAEAYADAKLRKILKYYTLAPSSRAPSINTLKQALNKGYGVTFGFSVPSWFIERVGNDGVMPMPKPNDKFDGGHAVLLVGCNDRTRLMKVRNSWGPTWGERGYFYMPYDFISNSDCCADFWYATAEGLGK